MLIGIRRGFGGGRRYIRRGLGVAPMRTAHCRRACMELRAHSILATFFRGRRLCQRVVWGWRLCPRVVAACEGVVSFSRGSPTSPFAKKATVCCIGLFFLIVRLRAGLLASTSGWCPICWKWRAESATTHRRISNHAPNPISTSWFGGVADIYVVVSGERRGLLFFGGWVEGVPCQSVSWQPDKPFTKKV